jgi:GntR family transcriptional regulator
VAEPMYRRIAEDLRHRIESGELPPGAQLPSEEELREEYGQGGQNVSRNTVRDAVKLLVSRGLIETRPGQGTFVLTKMTTFITKLNTDPGSGISDSLVYKSQVEGQGRTPDDTLRVEVQRAKPFVASELELDDGAQVILRHQERRIDGAPWSLQTTYYPMDLLLKDPAAGRLLEARSIEEGAIPYLKEKLGISQVGWRDTIIARPPNSGERVFFDLSDKVQVAVFEFRRTGYAEDGKPIRLTVTVYPADRNQFEMEAGDVPKRDVAIPHEETTTPAQEAVSD